MPAPRAQTGPPDSPARRSTSPAIWTSKRPVKSGATGAPLADIIAKAAALESKQPLAKRKPHRERQSPAIVPRDFALPEIPFDQLASAR